MKEVLDLDSKSAVTIFSSVDVSRDNPQDELGITDLENYISQAIWKLFDRSRADAAARLEINEVDLLLTDARVMGMKIDNNQIINPHGFTGRKLEMLLGITMVKRDKFVESTNPFEGGSVRAYLLSRSDEGLENAIYVEAGDTTTTIFSIQPKEIIYLNEFDWGGTHLIRAIQDEFGVDEFAARGMYVKFVDGDVSEEVEKKLSKIFYRAFGGFINGVVMGIRNFVPGGTKKQQPMYLRTFFQIPESVYKKRFTFNGNKIQFIRPNGGGDLQEFRRR